MRAIYVPSMLVPSGMAKLVATAPAAGDGAELTLYPVTHAAPERTRLSSAQLRGLLKVWAAAARAGQGQLEVVD
jgi:hypothetical protein